ncbi:MAG: hypothetical protein ACREFB_20375 [Stellaceae bacterium]
MRDAPDQRDGAQPGEQAVEDLRRRDGNRGTALDCGTAPFQVRFVAKWVERARLRKMLVKSASVIA